MGYEAVEDTAGKSSNSHSTINSNSSNTSTSNSNGHTTITSNSKTTTTNSNSTSANGYSTDSGRTAFRKVEKRFKLVREDRDAPRHQRRQLRAVPGGAAQGRDQVPDSALIYSTILHSTLLYSTLLPSRFDLRSDEELRSEIRSEIQVRSSDLLHSSATVRACGASNCRLRHLQIMIIYSDTLPLSLPSLSLSLSLPLPLSCLAAALHSTERSSTSPQSGLPGAARLGGATECQDKRTGGGTGPGCAAGGGECGSPGVRRCGQPRRGRGRPRGGVERPWHLGGALEVYTLKTHPGTPTVPATMQRLTYVQSDMLTSVKGHYIHTMHPKPETLLEG